MKKGISVVAFIGLFVVNTSRVNAQWVQTAWRSNMVNYVGSIYTSDTDVYVGEADSVYRSTDFGVSWTAGWVGNTTAIGPIIMYQGTLFTTAGSESFSDNGIFYSTDNGHTWYADTTGIGYRPMFALTENSGRIFAGGNFGVYSSSNNGTRWITNTNTSDNDSLHFVEIFSLAAMNDTIFGGTQGKGVYLSTNNGETWINSINGFGNIPYYELVNSLTVCDDEIFAGTGNGQVPGNGVYHFIKNTATWQSVNNGIKDLSITALVSNGSVLVAGTWSGMIYVSTNNGVNWFGVDVPWKGNSPVYALGINADYIYAGTKFNVYRRALIDFTTTVDEESPILPGTIELGGNYPNPFSTTTTISFTLPETELTTLKIYNTLGEEVATLVNGQEKVGPHSVAFQENDLQNGIYYYQLSAGKYTRTGKMSVLR